MAGGHVNADLWQRRICLWRQIKVPRYAIHALGLFTAGVLAWCACSGKIQCWNEKGFAAPQRTSLPSQYHWKHVVGNRILCVRLHVGGCAAELNRVTDSGCAAERICHVRRPSKVRTGHTYTVTVPKVVTVTVVQTWGAMACWDHTSV